MRLKITGDGTAKGTKLVDSDTGDEVEGVVKIKWSIPLGLSGKIKIELDDVDFDISNSNPTAVNSSPPPQIAPSGPSSGSSGPSPSGSPHYSYGYNPCGGASPSYTPSSNPNDPNYDPSAPLPDPNMPPDMMDDFKDCQHDWVNASFTGLRYVCKYCNVEKN